MVSANILCSQRESIAVAICPVIDVRGVKIGDLVPIGDDGVDCAVRRRNIVGDGSNVVGEDNRRRIERLAGEILNAHIIQRPMSEVVTGDLDRPGHGLEKNRWRARCVVSLRRRTRSKEARRFR